MYESVWDMIVAKSSERVVHLGCVSEVDFRLRNVCDAHLLGVDCRALAAVRDGVVSCYILKEKTIQI